MKLFRWLCWFGLHSYDMDGRGGNTRWRAVCRRCGNTLHG
jgi:hypothetical protein